MEDQDPEFMRSKAQTRLNIVTGIIPRSRSRWAARGGNREMLGQSGRP